MIIDSSALVAIALGEPERALFTATASAAALLQMSAATLVECGVVLDSRGPVAGRQLDELLDVLRIEVVPFDTAQARVARHAYQRFGRGSGSPAQLNLGDCFAYALAVSSAEPLLFKGVDFTHTDVLPALPRRA